METAMVETGARERVQFQEGPYLVKAVESDAEHRAAFRLRHRVFAEELRWVACRVDGLEIDDYDRRGVTIAVWGQESELVGMARILPGPGPFMLEREFRCFVSEDHVIRTEPDTMEITRLAVAPELRRRGESLSVMRAIFKGMYQWCLNQNVRYCYLEVEQNFLRVTRMLGFPCVPIGPAVIMPPGNTVSRAALLDLEHFRSLNAVQRPAFLHWMTTTEPEPPREAPAAA